MTVQFGNTLYHLGITIALIGIGFAVLWNGTTYFAFKDAEEKFAAIGAGYEPLALKKADLEIAATGRGISQEDAKWLTDRIVLSELVADNKRDTKLVSDALSRGVLEQDFDWLVNAMLELELVRHPVFTGNYEHFDNSYRAAKTSLDISVFQGGIMALIGLIAFGVGWTMRRILRETAS